MATSEHQKMPSEDEGHDEIEAAAEAGTSRVIETRVVEAREVHKRVVERSGSHISAHQSTHATTSDTHSQRSEAPGQHEPLQVSRERATLSHSVQMQGHFDEHGNLSIDSLQQSPAIDASLERSADCTSTAPSISADVAQVLAGAGSIQDTPELSEAALRARVHELEVALDHRERQIRAMQQTAQALLSHNTVEAMVRTTLDIAIQVLGAEAGSLLMHNPATDSLVFRCVLGPASETLAGYAIPATQGIAGQVFRSGTSKITQTISEHSSPQQVAAHFETEYTMTVPLKRHEGGSIGVMQILNSSTPFDVRDLEVIEVMAAQASAAIENARLVQEARKAEIVNVIGDISHDIKNMLTPIQSGVWTLEAMLDEMFRALDKVSATAPDATFQDRLREARDIARGDYGWILRAALDAAEKVQMRTKEIADAVKGESSAPLFIEGSMNQVAEEVARALRLVALDARLDLELELDEALPRAEFDHKQMYNALYNLVNNAIPETPADGCITICTQAPEADISDMLTIQVRDTGRGIAPHVKARLFTDDAISTKPGGTGLGTRIVGDVVKRHNGKISVESELGQGTTFTILLPLRHELQ
jgi:signal transduction histidine kinase